MADQRIGGQFVASELESLIQALKDTNASAREESERATASFEAALRPLISGQERWVLINSGSDLYGCWRQEVGYTLVRGDWRLAIRSTDGHESSPKDDIEEIWAFGEAPSYVRPLAADKLPELVTRLLSQAKTL